MKRIPIAHVFLTLNIGGMEKVGIDLINTIDSSIYENHVICLKEIGTLGEELKKNGQNVISLDKKDGFKLSVLFSLIEYFKEHKIKIVHTNNSGPHFWAGLAAVFCGIKGRVHTNHGRNFGWKSRRALLDRFSTLISTKLVCVSNDSAEKIIKFDKANPQKIKVITNGVDTQYFSYKPPCEQLIKDLGLQSNNIVIGSIARFSTDKDQETLIRAFSIIEKKIPEARLLLVGDGETKAKLEQLSTELNISNKVVFTGFRSDIVNILGLLSIYVLSSHTEGLSISLLEAMSTQRPVIATSVGGNPEIVKDGVNGLLVRENDVNHLAESMEKIIKSKSLSKQLSEAARKTVLEFYSIESMVDKYQCLYESLN